MYFIARLIINALLILLLSYIIPGIEVSGFYIALLVAIIFGLVNIFIKPLIILLTLPITILTLGLFILVINAFLFWLVSVIIPGFEVHSFWSALASVLIIWAVNTILYSFKK